MFKEQLLQENSGDTLLCVVISPRLSVPRAPVMGRALFTPALVKLLLLTNTRSMITKII